MRIEWARREDVRLHDNERSRVRRLNLAGATKFVRIIQDMEMSEDWNDFSRNPKSKLEALRGNRSGQYSMRLTQRHRLVFELAESPDTIRILQVGGHYD